MSLQPENPRKSGSRREFLYAAMTVLVSLLLTAVVLELGLRLLGYRGAPESIIGNMMVVEDPVLNWRFIPNSRFQQGKIVNQYNSMGFRGEDHAVGRPLGIMRIVVIGDSVTEGYGVEWHEVFGSVVQARLGTSREVISLGMGGLNAPQAVHVLEQRGLQFSPDYVVVNFVLNDCDFYSFMKRDGTDEERDSVIALLNIRINPRVKRLLKSSALIYLVNERVADLWGRIKGEPPHNYYREIWAEEKNRAKVTTAFAKLRSLSSSHRFNVVVLIWPLLTDFARYEFRDVHEWVANQAAANGFTAIDLLPVFATQSFRRLQVTSEDHVHPNQLGHQLAAAEFAKWMARALPSSPAVPRAQ
jgi:lysophospholipase L1-like esterase